MEHNRPLTQLCTTNKQQIWALLRNISASSLFVSNCESHSYQRWWRTWSSAATVVPCHWYWDGHAIIIKSQRVLSLSCSPLGLLCIGKKTAKFVHFVTRLHLWLTVTPLNLPSHHPPHSSVLVASAAERKWDTVGGLKESLLPVYDQPQVLSCSQGPTKLQQKAQARRWELKQQGIR